MNPQHFIMEKYQKWNHGHHKLHSSNFFMKNVCLFPLLFHTATAMSMSPMSKQNTWIERFWGKGHPVEQCFIPHYLISDTKSTHIGLGSIYFPINSIRGDGSRGLGPPLNFWINENKCAINQNSFLPDYFKMSRSRSLCLYWFLTPTLFTWWKFTTPSK